MVTGRIELGVGDRNSTGQVTKRRMIGIVHNRIVDDLPKEAEIWSRRFGESNLVNPHVVERYDQQWLIGFILTGNKGLPFQDVLSMDGEFEPNAQYGTRGQWRHLRRWPDKAQIGDGSRDQKLLP